MLFECTLVCLYLHRFCVSFCLFDSSSRKSDKTTIYCGELGNTDKKMFGVDWKLFGMLEFWVFEEDRKGEGERERDREDGN